MSRPPARPVLPPGVKVDFNSLKPPPGYVPGIGRGATGFTTRSDIGPSMPALGMAHQTDTEEGGQEKGQFDDFMGSDAGALAGGTLDEEDKEADAIWEAVDARMEEKWKVHSEKKMNHEKEKLDQENAKISEQFADLKRKLATLTEADWEAIPDIGDYTAKKRKMQQFVPAPDSLLSTAAGASQTVSALDARAMATGTMTPAGTTTDLAAIGSGRNTVVRLQLDKMSDSVSGQTVVDPKGYLTDLKSVVLKSDAEISDIKKARLLLKSVINTNPKHAPGWIAAARLEEVAGRQQQARELIMKGCELCPRSEDVWLEAARLSSKENAKALLARGVASLPDSVKIWIAAAKLEENDAAKKRVLLRALERIPQSVKLWKAAVELSDEDDARILLSRAVECCPQHVELWLALARLESYKNAQKVLNRARQAVPTSAEIWITASKLEESQGKDDMPSKIIPRALKSLQANGVSIEREWWLKEAEAAERVEPPMLMTCRAIVSSIVGLGVEEEDRKVTWMADAEEYLNRGAIETARTIYATAIESFPGEASIWRAAAELEKSHGTKDTLDALLLRAVQFCPQAEVLWLMAAKERWLNKEVAGARAILEEAFARNPDSEDIWLAAFKVEFESGETERARMLLAKARSHEPASTPRVWMKSALLERSVGNVEAERKLLNEGLERFPNAWKMHLMRGQMEERIGAIEAARAVYATGLRQCPHCVPLWESAARLEERTSGMGRSRAILEQSRLKNPRNERLWLAAVRSELRSGNAKAAESLMAKALQECPTSGMLWAHHVITAPRPLRKKRSADALTRCHDDPLVIAAVARHFWEDRKVDKARSWLERAVKLDQDNGDLWAQLYKFECQHGSAEKAADVVKRCVAADPHHGEHWQRVKKDPSRTLVNDGENTETLLKKVSLDLENPL